MSPRLHVVEPPDPHEVMARLSRMRAEHSAIMHKAWLGILVMSFDNDEIHAVAEYLAIGETLALRKLGLLDQGEGFDGSKKSRKHAEPSYLPNESDPT